MDADNDENIGKGTDNKETDPDFENPSKSKLRGETFTCEFVNGTWLEDVLPAFDRFGIASGAAAYILGHILAVGKVDPSKVICLYCDNMIRYGDMKCSH